MPRRAISLTDVLLAIFIIALAVGLLFPAVSWHRTQHRGRTLQSNNLRQIVLAVHNYNDAFGDNLPPLVDVGEGAPTGAGLRSLFFNILPFIEQDNVYRVFHPADPVTYAGRLDGAAQNIVRTFLNPVDATAPNSTVASATVALSAAPLLPFAQSFTGLYATTSFAANGMIPWNKGGLPRSFADGTSNTIMFAERPQVCTDSNGNTVYNLWGYGSYGPSTPAFALLTPACLATFPSTGQIVGDLLLPPKWTNDMSAVRIGRENAPLQPSPVSRSFQVGIHVGGPCDPRLAGSPHVGGMLAALADGSVRSLDPKMSDWTYWAALTPDGGEEPYSDW
jgi:hypothetical protein